MDVSTLWDQLLNAMERRIGHLDVDIWLRGAEPVSLKDGVLTVEVLNRYYADWISDNYLNHLGQEMANLTGRPTQLHFVTKEEPTAEVPRVTEPEPTLTDDSAPASVNVNHRQTFDSFVVGDCNKFAHAAALAVAENPGSNYNPLFIYGSTGLGKTHLMHAIANRVLAARRDARVVYATSEDFMNEMITYIRYKRMEDFRSKYRKATLLMIDDVQFLSGKDQTQAEFFHTFNALQNAGAQVVLTSDVIPRDIDKLEPRLRTRFEGGLIADMQAPDKETLIAILWQKADGLRIQIPPDLADAIAGAVRGNIRELEGILNKLSALHSFYSEPITLAFARKHLPNVFEPAPNAVTVSNIIEAVARHHNLRNADITGTKRTRNLTRPRQVAMYLARMHTNLSFPELGREFGGRDHSTIQYGYRKVDKERHKDPDLAYKIRLIEQSLGVHT